MHICLVSYRNILEKTAWGGVHTHARNLIHLLLERKHAVTFITYRGPSLEKAQFIVIPAGEISRDLKREEWPSRIDAVCSSVHQKKTIHLIISEGIDAAGLTTFSRKNHIPIAAFVHNLNMHYFYNNFQEVDNIRSLGGYLLKSLPHYLYGMLWKDIPFLKKCKRIVTGSSAIATHLHRYYRLNEEHISTIHNWVDTESMDFNLRHRISIRSSFGFYKSEKVFLMVGNLWRPKGFFFALDAFEMAVQFAPSEPIFLILIGEGPDRDRLEKRICRSPVLMSRVLLTGEITNDLLSQYYSAADTFILPSLLNEVLPYTLLEAMSCRLPIIATDIKASREILGKTVSLVRCRAVAEMAEAILGKVFSEANLLKSEGERNRRRIEMFFSKHFAAEKIDAMLNGLS